ncbi:BZ3500_MvSof-1268-A1-R1_Chr10-2g02982 [Microbotryum saponariae]|uniref:BZ3500_MvSof-1268-A1-R1_Chr10-2g02982 protein n=1 Tax=Microbotryum saponariae TaxID=289078 RepID=A0A2X0KCX0_9BASI|nr:BZ3501_MvSof-1269-A2-R1_Chr10-2g02568 [Microbotryum saponariae]SDA01871.1 BZ3500_MvSof-1268-A1-R1_Chr10-2g02982 [Microbotryum saponariae]
MASPEGSQDRRGRRSQSRPRRQAITLAALAPLLLSSWFLSTHASPTPAPSTPFTSKSIPLEGPVVKLHGRFLHLTDMHPDPFYLFNSSEATSCHTHAPSKGSRAGYWGTSVSDCDAPLTLLNSTFDWLEQHFKGKVDFVVWTGDNARHDIDTRFPRSMPEIYELNRYISSRMRQTFGNKVPIVTSFGNNGQSLFKPLSFTFIKLTSGDPAVDIFPHNIMFGGPSAITSEFLKLWKHYIPEEHLHTFARGGYYSVEAIPNQLVLVSLNTLYFYENNKGVDGCPSFSLGSSSSSSFKRKKDDDPGTEELLWLEQQLLLARMRGMQVWLTGHVPPTKSNYYEGCYSRYGELMLAYQDTILGGLFGHMNVDHFSLIQADDVLPPPRKSKKHKKTRKQDRVLYTTGSSTTLVNNLLQQFQGLPKRKHLKEKDYSVVHINPSVIPTYLPTFRVWEYNTTVGEGSFRSTEWATDGVNEFNSRTDEDEDVEDKDEEEDELTWEGEERDAVPTIPRLLEVVTSQLRIGYEFFRGSKSSDASLPVMEITRKKKKRRKQQPRRRLPRYSSPNAPGRSNRFLTPLGFTQYYLELDQANEFEGFGSEAAWQKGGDRPRPVWNVEYVTMPAETVARRLMEGGGDSEETDLDPFVSSAVWPAEVLNATQSGGSVEDVVQMLRQLDLTPYELDDLTLGSWLCLARRIAKGGKAWKNFRKRMFVSSGAGP